jgi:tRNA(fMet)-specific endonuclease VapC
MKFLLDTDTCVHVLRGNKKVIKNLLLNSSDDVAISSITHYELLVGVMKCTKSRQAAEREKVSTFISQLHEIPFTNETALIAASIRAELESQGLGIGAMDTLIAATAIEAGLILVTGNAREFSRVSELKLLDWS